MHNNSAKSKTKFNLKITFPYILFSSLFLTQSCSAIEKEGYYRGYETPEYKIIKKFENIEIRQYEPTLVAEVMVDGDREQAANKGFRILARYIFGKNIAQEKLAMTSPVEQKKSPLSLRDTETRHESRPALRGSPSRMQKGHTGKKITPQKIRSEKLAMTSPVSQIPLSQTKENQQNWLIQFTMPKKYNIDNLPKAKDERIKFKIQKAKKVVAIRFKGVWSDKKFNEEKEKLKKFAITNNLEIKANPIMAYYDDPFTFPWNRRNEIIWEIR